jgi:hypothetical protein
MSLTSCASQRTRNFEEESMDFGKAFTFMFADPNWLRKLGIGTLVGLLGIVLMPILIGVIPLLMVVGYTLDALRNVVDGKEFPMPEWNEWGGFLIRGLKLTIAFVAWSLPIFIIMIPLFIGTALTSNQNSSGTAFGVLLITCSSCLTFLWGLFLLLISPAIYIRLAVTGRLGAAFEVGRLWALTRDNLGNVIHSRVCRWVDRRCRRFAGDAAAMRRLPGHGAARHSVAVSRAGALVRSDRTAQRHADRVRPQRFPHE